jgi:hypothetical protein
VAGNDQLLEAIQRGRHDYEFFGSYFLGRTPHPGQIEWHQNANATFNVLPTSNRWGKTTAITDRHFHHQMYKVGAEWRYLDEHGRVDSEAFMKCRYRTVHTADLWDTASLVWEDALRIMRESKTLETFVKDSPMSKPPHIDFIWGGRWKFRTLGNDASGIDGDSYYLITVDEGGWISDLLEKINNVLRVRVADVRGKIDVAGTMKPGISRDFFMLGVRASAATGYDSVLSYRGEEDEKLVHGGLDRTIQRYLRDLGISEQEFAEAIAG